MRIFYDIETQNDFMNEDGTLYVPGAEEIKPNLKILTEYARGNGIQILGSVDRHFGTEEWKAYELELQKWGGLFPDHCMDGTEGQKKITGTTFAVNFIENTSPTQKIRVYTTEEMDEIVSKNFVFEKQGYSLFPTEDCPGGNKYAEKILERAGVEEAVVYGVATDYCVLAAVVGMQQRGIQCYVVEDAIRGVAPETTEKALEEMVGAGAVFVTTKDVLEERI